MIYSALRDLVRTKLGDPSLDPTELDLFMDGGRHELESRGNYYYEAGRKTHTLVSGEGNYSLTSTTSGPASTGTSGLNLTSYKEHRSLFIQDVSGTTWLPLEIGSWHSGLDMLPTTSAKPQMAVVENETLWFVPTPNAAYPIVLLHWNWSANPALGTSTDELLTRWYMALLYAACWVGKKYITQDVNAGKDFESLMLDQIELMKEFTNRRMREPVNKISTSEAATILQAAGSPQ